MSDYASRGRGVGGGAAPPKHAETVAPPTPAEQAADRAAVVIRDAAAIGDAIQTIRGAQDPRGWSEARQHIDRRLASTRNALDRARSLANDLTPEVAQQLAVAEATLAHHERIASTLTEAPRGWTKTSREAEILAVMAAPIEGSARDGWTRRLVALKAELAQLSVAESRALAARLSKRYPNDPIAQRLVPNVRITQAHFEEVLAFLAGARKREAMRPAAVKAAPAPPSDILRLEDEPIAPVHRKAPTRKERSIPTEATRIYLATNSNTVWDAIRAHLKDTSWPASAQFTWRQPAVFSEKVVAALHDAVMQGAKAGDIDLSKLDALLYPARVHEELSGLLPIQTNDEHSTIAPSRHWIPAVGLRLGQLVQAALVPSLHRLTQRYVDATNVRAEQAMRGPVQLSAHDLITSAPIDRHVARALVAPGVAEVIPDGSVRPVGRTSLRPVRLTWEQRDPRLWNWVRADLADATAEEVAASLFG